MKVSTAWLQTFFDVDLPQAEKLENALTFHSSEIEEIVEKDGDTILDVKVLPDKSAWMLSHRGVAKELATILNIPFRDPLSGTCELKPETSAVSVALTTEHCNRYSAALIRGVTIAESPEWLRRSLESIGQRSINNVVDATNYVMFHLGQPLHAFDAGKLGTNGGSYELGVRMARGGEQITTLTGESYELSPADMLIVDRTNDAPIGIAGVKGGKHAEVNAGTTDIVIESANFDRVSVRKTSQRLKLRTDASARYENGVVPELAACGLVEAVRLIAEIAGGTLEGYADAFPHPRETAPVTVSLAKVNGALGLSLTKEDVEATIARFGYAQEWTGDAVTIVPPFERDDLAIAEDIIEEIGRIHGLAHVPTVTPEPVPLAEYNKQFYYAEAVRAALLTLGFSEVFTSSFRSRDAVKLENALAADKGCLRSDLRENLKEALVRNAPNKDLLGLDRIAIFEIGTVFGAAGEHTALVFGVRHGVEHSSKKDDPVVREAIAAVTGILGFEHFKLADGVAEANFTEAIADLPEPTAYEPLQKSANVSYKPFSPYPSISRDIALWVPENASAEEIATALNERAGELRVRTTLFDEFKKDGRTSYAFRLVFQSREKTLESGEVDRIMDLLYEAARARGWEVR